MNKTKNAVKLSLLVGTSLGLSQNQANAENLFSFSNIGEASCVRTALSTGSLMGLELGCGAKEKGKSKEHKCGKGKCGGCDKKEAKGKSKEHKCGEGKCGGDKKEAKGKSKEHKCGESTCGGKVEVPKSEAPQSEAPKN